MIFVDRRNYHCQKIVIMNLTTDVHQQFADYFPFNGLKPYIYLLSKKLSEGHICIDVDTIDGNQLEAAGYPVVVDKNLLFTKKLISDGNRMTPFVLLNNNLYLQRYFNYESIILTCIKDFIANEKIEYSQKIEAINKQAPAINAIINQDNFNNINGTNWQVVAIIAALINNFTIITGGPGTGKTTTVAKILSILFAQNPSLKVALTAPTGKAAARMKESLENAGNISPEIKSIFNQLQPSTIHRLLGVNKNSPHFKFNKENPLQYDLVIVDESSMIDVALFAKFLSAVAPGTKLILLGDKDQLASVEAGSLFGDLCNAQPALNIFSNERIAVINQFIENKTQQLQPDSDQKNNTHPLFEHIIELQQSHRFADDKGIGKLSKAIINNQVEGIEYFFKNMDDQVTIDTNYSEKMFQQFIIGYKDFIQEPDILMALKKINNLRVLCAVREGEQGLYAINKKIEHYLIQQNLLHISGDFYNNRPIMLTSNNIELQLFNGDIGLVRPDGDGVLKAWFQTGKEEIKAVLPGYISKAETVFAMTIHKSQGSEFNKVLVILPKGEEIKLLTRELLYTAVTRAKEKLILQGTEPVILETSFAMVQRCSGIIERFKQNN